MRKANETRANEAAELEALRLLAEAVRAEEREPCGGTVDEMREALRAVDKAQGRASSEWMEAA